MKYSSTEKTAQKDRRDPAQAGSKGPDGTAIAPPAYGIDFIDQGNMARPKNNTGLPDALKSGVEGLSGVSLDDVRVHYNSSKPAQLQALAYTQGAEIHVGPGQERHLPHEAWHVVQQKKGAVGPIFKLRSGTAINDSPRLEQEANSMGARAKAIGGKVHPLMTRSTSLGKSPDATNAPPQLKSGALSSGDVIQRQVDTWGGEFSETDYAPKKERLSGNDLIGAYIKITFTPNENCPKNVKIGLIQIVRVIGAEDNPGLHKKVLHPSKQWAIDRQRDSNPVYGSLDTNAKKSKSLTDNPPMIEVEQQNLLDDTPVEVGAQVGKRRKTGTRPAILIDDPRVFLERYAEQRMLFETTAMVLEGEQKGLALGTVRWGWTKEAGDTDPVLENFELVQDRGSNENFEQAREVWNAAAEEYELVPIPDITGAPAPTGGKGCFLTTACMEYKGLPDNCEELITLRQFRDTYLMQKSNGPELVDLYYQHSPGIVAAIHEQADQDQILEELYRIIRQCVDAIKVKNHEWAYQTYCKTVMELKERFIPEVQTPPISL